MGENLTFELRFGDHKLWSRILMQTGYKPFANSLEADTTSCILACTRTLSPTFLVSRFKRVFATIFATANILELGTSSYGYRREYGQI